eukprot:8549189-Ditylum_brightwellii.AAC.1
MERKKQNKHDDCNKDNNGDNDVDNDVDNGDDGNDDDGINVVDDGAEKHLTHFSQAAECCLMGRSKQSKHVVCSEDNDVNNGDHDSVVDGDGDDVEDGVDGVDN